MKRILTLSAFLLLIFQVQAQSPGRFNYQAVVRDAQGTVLPNQAVSFRFGIRSGSATGTLVYQETHAATTNAFGLVNLSIGGGTVVSGTFSAINWAGSSHFVQVELDPAGGSSYTSLGTQQLISVPYALHAATVENDLVDDADADPTNELQTLSGTGADVTLSNGGGTVTVDVNDADSDPTNEYNQGIGLVGTVLGISDGGGILTVDLSSLAGGAAWQQGTGVVYNLNDNIGIGLNNPNADLVVTDAVAPTIRLGHTTFNNVESGRLVFDEDVDDTGDCGFMFDHNGNANTLRLITGCNIPTAGDTAMMVSRGDAFVRFPQRVRIGDQASPTSDLQVKQSTDPTTNPTTGGLSFEMSTGTSSWQVWHSNPFLSFAYNGTRVAYVDNTTGAWTTTSDRRLKRNVADLEPVLGKVMQLRPVQFNYQHQTDDSRKVIGFVAQDVQSLFPQSVSRSGEEDLLAISYSDFGVIAVKAIQEQQQVIDAQQAEIGALKARLARIESLLNEHADAK